MTSDSSISNELIHAKYPVLKELWMLVYESDSLYHKISKLQKSLLNKFPTISNKLNRLKEKNIKRYQRRIRIYHTTRKMVVDSNERLYGGGQAL